MKKKYKILIIQLILLPGILLAQESKSISNKENDKIVFDYKIEEGKKIKTLIFSNRNLILENDEIATVSPNGKIAGVLKYSKSPKLNASVNLFNEYSDVINSFEVAPLDKICVANNGKFVIYGFEPREGAHLPNYVRFYTQKGVEIIPTRNEYGMYVFAVFSDEDDILVVAGVEEKSPKEIIHVNITIYDKAFNKIGEYKIDNLSGYSILRAPLIDSYKDIIKVLISSGSGINYKVDTTYLDFSGTKLKFK